MAGKGGEVEYSAEAHQEPLLEQRDVEGHSDGAEQSKGESYEFESPARPWWRGNVNLYLGIVYFIVLWFVFARGPSRFEKPISLIGGIHVVAACLYGIINCMNFFHTPSHGAIYRRIHMNLGRVGMVAGVVSAVLGFIVLYAEDNSMGMRIGLSYAAVAQLGCQVMGMYSLFKPKRDIQQHKYYMSQSLLFTCLIPALMRLPQLTGSGIGESWESVAWMFTIPVYLLHNRAERRSKWY